MFHAKHPSNKSRSRGRIFTFEFALIRNVLDSSKDLPPFVSYRFDILQAGFRDTGKFVDPSTGVGHEAIKASLVQGSRVQSQNCKSKRVDIEPNVELRYSPRQQSEPKCSKRSRCLKVYVGSSRSTRSSAAPSLRFAPLAINFPAMNRDRKSVV
mgnify:CR=1 FL=1